MGTEGQRSASRQVTCYRGVLPRNGEECYRREDIDVERVAIYKLERAVLQLRLTQHQRASLGALESEMA